MEGVDDKNAFGFKKVALVVVGAALRDREQDCGWGSKNADVPSKNAADSIEKVKDDHARESFIVNACFQI